MNRVDRYILGLFWSSFLAGLLVFVTLFLASDAMSTFLRYADADSAQLVRYYLYYLPEIIHKMWPVACVVGTVMTISSLNKGSELIALFAAGLSLFRIARMILVSILVLSVVDYFVSDQLLPTFSKQKNFTFYNEISKNPGKFQTIKTNKIWYRSKNTIFNIKTVNAEGNLAQGLTLYFFDNQWNLIQLITAKSVVLDGTNWTLKEGAISVFNTDSSFPLNDEFQEKKIAMSEDAQDLRSTGQTSDLLTQAELSQFIDRNKEAGLDTVKYEVEYHVKFSFALAGLVMSLLSLPFCVGHNRGGGGMVRNIGICLGLVMAYWVLHSSSQTLGVHGSLNPILSAWLANILMSSVGVFFLLRLRR
jgi:lipopolysaccharide export system permease protein